MAPEIIVDSFAGGGGASTGIEMALGRSPDVAINHDPEAVALHIANHPATEHYCQSVWQVRPEDAAAARPVGLLWASPDCKHFSKAKGGAPVSPRVRDLAWVVVEWAEAVRPRVIILENVEEFRTWGPVVDGRPCPERRGETFVAWVGELKRLGYRVDWRELSACDYGAPTTRKRLFLIARRDGAPIVWPAPTHGPGLTLPWRVAADIIDWSLPCPSIFGRSRPLAGATERRIAAGLRRFVIDAAEPFIIPVTHQGDSRVYGSREPLRTITTAQRGEFALVTAWLAKHYGGVTGIGPARPIGTVTTVDHHALVTSNLVRLRGGEDSHIDGSAIAATAPVPTITGGGTHIGEVRAFLIKYYGACADGQPVTDPVHTITSKHRMGLVTVAGEDYQIADIGMRMLQPRELYRAQGFPDGYRIDVDVSGKPLSKTAQVRMCGNSVCPPVAAALVAANVPELAAYRRGVAA